MIFDPPDARLWDDFVLFSRALILSGDYDATGQLLRTHLAKLPCNVQIWRLLVAITWWHLGSAERVWTAQPTPGEIIIDSIASLQTSAERRGFRGPGGAVRARGFLRGAIERARGDFAGWVESFGRGEPGWRSAKRELGEVLGAGPWACGKWPELLVGVLELELEAPGCISRYEKAGPATALAQLTGRSIAEVSASVEIQNAVLGRVARSGVPISGHRELRACLTAFDAMVRGRYYVGASIDAQLGELDGASQALWKARACFPKPYRGEVGKPPWLGPRVEFKRAYADRREIVNLWV